MMNIVISSSTHCFRVRVRVHIFFWYSSSSRVLSLVEHIHPPLCTVLIICSFTQQCMESLVYHMQHASPAVSLVDATTKRVEQERADERELLYLNRIRQDVTLVVYEMGT